MEGIPLLSESMANLGELQCLLCGFLKRRIRSFPKVLQIGNRVLGEEHAPVVLHAMLGLAYLRV